MAITSLINDSRRDVMLVSEVIKFQDQYYIEYTDNNELVNCTTNIEELKVCGEFVGINKISNEFYLEMSDYFLSIMNDSPKIGYEFTLLHIAQKVRQMHTLKLQGLRWYEIDDDKDLAYAEENIVITD